MVKWFPKKLKSKNTKKLTRVRKMCRNPNIHRTRPILHFFRFFKICWDFIWVGWCLNRFITLRMWLNDFRKNPNPKILKKINRDTKNVRNPHILRILPILHFFGVFKIFWDFIWIGYCLNRFITLKRWWNDFRKIRNPKIQKNLQGYEECEESSHSLYPPNSPLLWTF